MNLLGISKFNAGRYSEAIDTYKRNVAQGGPVGAPMLHVWVAAYVAAGRINEARENREGVAEILSRVLPEALSLAPYV